MTHWRSSTNQFSRCGRIKSVADGQSSWKFFLSEKVIIYVIRLSIKQSRIGRLLLAIIVAERKQSNLVDTRSVPGSTIFGAANEKKICIPD